MDGAWRAGRWSDGLGAQPARRLLSLGVPVLVVGAGAVGQLVHGTGRNGSPASEAALLSALLVLPLFWRLRFPVAAFLVIAAVALVQWAADVRLVADAALLIGVYSVSARHPARVGLASAIVVEVGAVLAVFRWNPASNRLESLILLSGPLLAAMFAGMAVRNQRLALAAATERADQVERERHRQAEIEVAVERARIAREMHDVVAHGLTVIVTMSEAAVKKHAVDPARAKTAMQQVAATGREALNDMRRVLGVLHTGPSGADHQPQPGLADLDGLFGQVRQTGLAVVVTVRGRAPDLGRGTQLSIYRLLQEALTNVLKHARQATRVEVEIGYLPDRVTLQIDDDGQLAANPAHPGYGITGMTERAAVYHGQVSAGPGPRQGWRVRAELLTPGGLP